jgi:hypothetical protein
MNIPVQPAPTRTMKTPQEIYLEGQKLANFQPGERVKVAFKVPSRAGGWKNDWVDRTMDGAIGKGFSVDCVKDQGVRLSYHHQLRFPWFCLERVGPEPVEVELNDTWTAEVLSKTEVKVGCQTFTVKAIRDLEEAAKAGEETQDLNGRYVARIHFPQATITVEGKSVPVENLRKLLAAVDSFGG